MQLSLSLGRLPWYGQVGAFVTLAAIMLASFWNFYAEPFQAELAAKQARLDGLRAEINTGLATASQLPEFQARVGELETRLESLRAVLPDQKDVADLLRRIQALATQSNLTIRGFRPQPTVTQEMHVEWPITLELEGTYHNLGIFFDRIGRFSRIINISGISIRPREPTAPNATIVAECTATTFVLLDTAGGEVAGVVPATVTR